MKIEAMMNDLIKVLDDSSFSPLESYVACKELEKRLEDYRNQIISLANEEYTGPCTVLNSKLKNYTPRSSWTYSDDVVKAEENVKAMKKVEERTGVAIKKDGVIDINKTALFTVTLNK